MKGRQNYGRNRYIATVLQYYVGVIFALYIALISKHDVIVGGMKLDRGQELEQLKEQFLEQQIGPEKENGHKNEFKKNYEKEHWFSFGKSCVVVKERVRDGHLPRSLVFLHGRFGHSHIWNPLIDNLSNQYRCLAVDFPGFGRSTSLGDHPFSFLEHTSLVHELIGNLTAPDEKVVLIGHDVGGIVAQLCSIRAPEKIAALVLINSSDLNQNLGKMWVGFRGFLARWKMNQLLKLAATLEPAHRASLVESWSWKNGGSRMALARAIRGLEDSWPKSHPWDHEGYGLKKAIQNLKQPVLLLWGKKDKLNPPEIAMEMAQKLPEAYFYLHENSGHWPNLEQPDWVLLKMKEFIFKIEPKSASIRSFQKFL